MEPQSLYLKHRPQTLDDIIGNSDVVEVLRSQLSDGKVPRALLFHGPTGCGKTTLGRIIAKELGAKGSDIREIDAADFRGIDAIREIRKQIGFRPLQGSYQVWILDEVHRATTDAQSALLKMLEDTPSHVYFILCTTDPQKLLAAIRGRCSDYHVQQLQEREMKMLLRKVVKAEGESIEKAVYDQIAQDSQGHPRNALQILQQVLAVQEDKRLAVAQRASEEQAEGIDLCRALLDGSPWKKVANILTGLKSVEGEKVRRLVLGYCQSVLLKGQNDTAAQIMEEFEHPMYDIGFPGVVLACYRVVCGTED